MINNWLVFPAIFNTNQVNRTDGEAVIRKYVLFLSEFDHFWSLGKLGMF